MKSVLGRVRVRVGFSIRQKIVNTSNKLKFKKDCNMIVVVGDVHGEFPQLYEGLRMVDARGVTFVQLGDFGLGFESPAYDHKVLTRMNDHLTGKESMLYVIRGNHDNPSFWTDEGRMEFTNIKFVKDNTVLELDGKRCLFAGGAPSVDRRVRTKGVSFWENECYKYSPFDADVDLVFTHEVYHGASNFTTNNHVVKHFAKDDPTLMDYLLDNQKEMEKFYLRLKEANEGKMLKWYHGHYHVSDVCFTDGFEVNCLSIHEFKEVR